MGKGTIFLVVLTVIFAVGIYTAGFVAGTASEAKRFHEKEAKLLENPVAVSPVEEPIEKTITGKIENVEPAFLSDNRHIVMLITLVDSDSKIYYLGTTQIASDHLVPGRKYRITFSTRDFSASTPELAVLNPDGSKRVIEPATNWMTILKFVDLDNAH